MYVILKEKERKIDQGEIKNDFAGRGGNVFFWWRKDYCFWADERWEILVALLSLILICFLDNCLFFFFFVFFGRLNSLRRAMLCCV